MGRNSVTPWTTARMTAWTGVTRKLSGSAIGPPSAPPGQGWPGAGGFYRRWRRPARKRLYSRGSNECPGEPQESMETILITGGAGFIGCNFVRLVLAETGARVLVLDKLTYAGSLENLAGVLDDPRLEFLQGDIADRREVRAIFAEHRPTAVVNFAAESHVDRSIDDASAFIQTNIVGAFELLEAARHYLAGLAGLAGLDA